MSDPRSPAERLIDKLREPEDSGRGLSRHARQYQRSLEGYLQAGHRPRWMERLGEIEAGIQNETRRLQRAYDALRREHPGDHETFAARWRALARSWPFDDVNELIRQHNEWFPIERQLPMDPRTRDYVLIHGRSYRRPRLDRDWVLEQFPA